MILTSEMQDKLDSPVKSFEVAFRCYVSNTLITSYNNKTALKTEIEKRSASIKDSKTIFSGKFQAEAKSFLGTKEWDNFWDNINFAKKCFDDQEQSIEHDVTFVSQIMLITYIFQDLFQPLILQFDSPTNYMTFSQKYYEIRNALSHRASSIISDIDAEGSINFIKIASNLISDDYFWYCDKSKIEKMLDEYYSALNSGSLELDNLSMAPFPNNKIVCRDPEISELFKFVCGWDGCKRLRNKKHIVCISGYGGIGKTSLVLEFVSHLLHKIKTNEYLGMRPSFILFYSAKEQMLDISDGTGSIKKKRLKSQFNDLESIKALIFHDLNITGFDDFWRSEGIIIVDNLESLSNDARHKVMEFLYEEVPSSIQIIITTRIPEEDVDQSLPINGFRDEAGLKFIKQFTEQNEVTVNLNDAEMSALVKYSFGNSLVLVLALKRLATGKTTYHSIITEMKNLPSDNTENIITQFMFQNTINEILKVHSAKNDVIKSILICLSLSNEPLSASIIMAAHEQKSLLISEIESILKILTEYLITDKVNDCYSINEFASKFILVNMHPSMDERKKWEQRLISASNDNKDKIRKINQLKNENPKLQEVIEDWNTGEEDTLTISYAFDLYNQKYKINSSNVAYEVDQLRISVEDIQHKYGAHPYLFYQYARILNELKQEGLIDDGYKDVTIQNYEKCIMMIDDTSFVSIKKTKTYPSILWIYAIYLLGISSYEKASNYSSLSIKKYEKLKLKTREYYDAIAVYCLSEIELYKQTKNKTHLKNSIEYRKKIHNNSYPMFNDHLNCLDQELARFKKT